MSSGLLYLAIVAVWAGVLVPMWVRGSDAGEAQRSEPDDVPRAPRGQGRARARIVARRRRRLSGIVLLFVVTVVIAATGVAPWWIVPVPGTVLVGYLACLRAAAAYDAELAERDRVRAERFEEEHEEYGAAAEVDEDSVESDVRRDVAAVAERDPRVIEFPVGGARGGRVSARGELFDQYADEPRRVVGD